MEDFTMDFATKTIPAGIKYDQGGEWMKFISFLMKKIALTSDYHTSGVAV